VVSGKPSTTVWLHFAFKLSAKDFVKFGGMCCTSKMGSSVIEQSFGSISAKDFGPPVETPMTIACMGFVCTEGFAKVYVKPVLAVVPGTG